MKTIADLDTDIAAFDDLSYAVADAALQLAAERGYDRQVAGLATQRAFLKLMLIDANSVRLVQAFLRAESELHGEFPPLSGNA